MWLVEQLRNRLQEWIDKVVSARRPKGHSILLNQKRIYIFPTASGWSFLFLCILLFFIATNYQNNLIHAVAYLLVALGVLTIHFTYLNLSGLRITALRGKNCFAGDSTYLSVLLESENNRNYETILLNWKGQPEEAVHLEKEQAREVELNLTTEKRGRLKPGPLKIETTYPFGLLRAWSWIELDLDIVVFPKPQKGPRPDLNSGDQDSQSGNKRTGDDFFGLEEYQPGQSTKHIAWKQYAQGRGLLVKRYVGQQSRKVWLNWESWPDLPMEPRLSVLCYWAIQLEHEGIDFGLMLPNKRIEPTSGPDHLERVLTVLAVFGGANGNTGHA